jgi:cytochrome c peroxidase
MIRLVALALLLVGLAAPAAHADEIVVGQKNKQFSLAKAMLKPGDKITFMNDDTVAHNVLATDPGGATSNSGVQDPGENAVVVFDKPGTYEIECGIHPKMKMTVTVTVN